MRTINSRDDHGSADPNWLFYLSSTVTSALIAIGLWIGLAFAFQMGTLLLAVVCSAGAVSAGYGWKQKNKMLGWVGVVSVLLTLVLAKSVL